MFRTGAEKHGIIGTLHEARRDHEKKPLESTRNQGLSRVFSEIGRMRKSLPVMVFDSQGQAVRRL